MLTRAVLPHTWVVGDDEFGRSTAFRRDLRELGERYLLAVPSNTLVRDLKAEPPPYCGHGKRPMAPFVRVDKLGAQLPANAWTRIDVRDGEKGPLEIHITTRRVLAITERTHPEREEVLVITRRVEDDGTVVHDYWLSNAAPQTPRKEFARAAKARGRIEQCLQRGKSETGLADYETRSWQGWFHHQTLSLMATWFLVLEQLRGKKNAGDHAPPTASRNCHNPIPRHRPSRARPTCPRNAGPPRTQRGRTPLPLQKP